MSVFQPDTWLTSAFDSLTDYIKGEIDAAVKNDVNANAGLQVYELVMDYPTPDTLPKPAEFLKTIIHLEIDDIDNQRLGFGQDIVKETIVDAVPPVGIDPGTPGTVVEEEGKGHEINFDIGVWASDKSGGTTSRLKAYQMLMNAFGTELARERCATVTQGVEIRRFNNGRFVIDKINDIRVFRMVGAELVVRVFSRHVPPVIVPEVFADLEPIQNRTVKSDDGVVIVDS